MTPSRRSAGAPSGYTLLEMLIAIAASALLLALLSQTLAALQQPLKAAREKDAIVESMQPGRSMVARLLTDAFPPAAGDDATAFVGSPSDAEFVTSPPLALAALGPLRLRLSIAPAGTDQLGLFAEARTTVHGGGPQAIRRTLLVGGLSWARIAYAADPSGAYLDHWPRASGKLPAVVQLRWKFAGEIEEREPVVVAPRRTLTNGCRFDPISLSCESGA